MEEVDLWMKNIISSKINMETITKEFIINFIDKHHIECRSSQKKLSLPIIRRLYKKMMHGIRFAAIKIDDGLICDGHHRYIASLLADFDIPMTKSFRTKASEEISWHLIDFDENDWDSRIKVDLLNQEDASYNDISIESLLEILK
jgi:hypothetical protein